MRSSCLSLDGRSFVRSRVVGWFVQYKTTTATTVTGVTQKKLGTSKTCIDLFSQRANKLNFTVLFSTFHWLKEKVGIYCFCSVSVSFVIGCLDDPGNSGSALCNNFKTKTTAVGYNVVSNENTFSFHLSGDFPHKELDLLPNNSVYCEKRTCTHTGSLQFSCQAVKTCKMEPLCYRKKSTSTA